MAEVGRRDGGQSQVDEADSMEAAIRQGFYDFFDDSFAGRGSKPKRNAMDTPQREIIQDCNLIRIR